MALHSHQFVETYQGLVGFGLNRETNENTVMYYLQKFSDDQLMAVLIKRLSGDELTAIFDLLSSHLSRHLDENEYHRLFLKEAHGE